MWANTWIINSIAVSNTEWNITYFINSQTHVYVVYGYIVLTIKET